MFRKLGLAVLVVVAVAIAVPPPRPAQAATVPVYDHIFEILMENHSYNEVIGAPYIAKLASQGAVGGRYFATDHPSLPNYAELTSGQSFPNASTDCSPSPSCSSSARNLADTISASGRTWKSYAESMGTACNPGNSTLYAPRHVPFLYYTDIPAATCQANVVDYSNLATDLRSTATTPSYAFITPNVIDDMHSGTIAQGDTWLSTNVPAILASPAFVSQHSLLVVTWDEDDGTQSNQVALIAVGYGIASGVVSTTTYNHYSLLRTIETSWSLPALTSNDSGAAAMTNLFGAGPSPFPSWATLGGVTTSDPSAASWSSGHVDAFARGTDDAVWHRAWNGTSWLPWESLGGILTSGPASVSGTTNRIDVFSRGVDGATWHRTWNGTAWQAWESLGGIATSGPATASSSATRIDLFVRGSDGALWHRWWDGTTWQAWESLGGSLTSDPGATSTGTNRLDVFARGVDGALWHRSWNGVAWAAWESLGGLVKAAAAVSTCTASTFDVFVVGVDNAVWRNSFTSAGWSGWTSAGGSWTSGPGAVCEPGTTTIELFERGTDLALWRLETS
jgi:hypothetical protein